MGLNQEIDAMKEDLIAAVQGCIRIKSVKDIEHAAPEAPFGPGVREVLDWTLALGKEMGFSVKNVDGYAGHIEMGEGDLLGILGHLDVVPEGDGWSVPPYDAAIVDGKILGRGALDDKGPTLAALFAMKAIKDAGIPLNMRVRLILGTDEESGWEDMNYYFKKEEVPQIGFAPDAEFPVIHAEKGILHLELSKDNPISFPHIDRIQGGERANVVPDRCDIVLKGLSYPDTLQALKGFSFPEGVSGTIESYEADQIIKILIQGSGAHGSLPQNGKNAVLFALQFLQTLPLSPEEQKQIAFILKYPGTGFYGEGFGINFEDEPSGKLSLNVGILEWTSQSIRFVLDIRYPVTFQSSDVLDPIASIAQNEQYKVKILAHQEAHHVPKESILVQSLLKAYSEVTGYEPFAFAIGGGTYAKALPQGVAFGPVFPGEPDAVHCPDEFISVDNLLLTAKVYAQAILNLAAGSKSL
ncbi:dipeptidase, putative [Desulfosporosinus orientis DSM 765]|uniref:Dipeptidase, putative n=1 Tax=Desulfosporosinus orientis (strain ATCC 19365 / DSM 765 / NCIMB 8382 / VKM B-1628 / Singapore I) TaxID=768706 RepID=G7W9A4_DESOD|nr:dipeptidase PepV [Desulfosporosinus orientis]AET68745.1 dipeptidase, putative [Desulfosporosinus orientis DSM 765]